MAEPARKERKISLSMMPDWTQLPEELLHLIITRLDNCFEVVHARSVCHSWRSTFPLPSCLLRPSYSPPPFTKLSKGLCTLEKVPVFLFRVRTSNGAAALPSEYFLGGIGRDDDHMEPPSPLQCSVKVKIQDSDPTLINTLDCQIIYVGYQYKIISWDPEVMGYYKDAVFLPLNKEKEGREFVVFLPHYQILLVLLSGERRWKQVKNIPDAPCNDLVTFRGRIYLTYRSGDVFICDPYNSLQGTLLMPSHYSLQETLMMPLQPLSLINYLIPSANDELFLVEKFVALCSTRSACRVSRLDEEAGKWVVVSDLGERVLLICSFGNFSCSAKELPHGCGVTGNSILFTNEGKVTFAYKYKLNIWRSSRENRLMILNQTPVMALRIDREAENLTLDT